MISYYIIAFLIVILAVIILWEWRHQRRLSIRARLMREALRNRDFMFRLPTDGIMPGERDLQTMLNDMGGEINQLMARSEVESWQRLTRVLTHEIMNAVTPIQSITQAYMGSTMVKQTPLEEGIRAIYDTTRSLSAFVESYRKMTQLQTVTMEEIELERMVANLKSLYPKLSWQPYRHCRCRLHATADKQQRFADTSRSGTRGIRAFFHHQAFRFRHRSVACPSDDDGTGREPDTR